MAAANVPVRFEFLFLLSSSLCFFLIVSFCFLALRIEVLRPIKTFFCWRSSKGDVWTSRNPSTWQRWRTLLLLSALLLVTGHFANSSLTVFWWSISTSLRETVRQRSEWHAGWWNGCIGETLGVWSAFSCHDGTKMHRRWRRFELLMHAQVIPPSRCCSVLFSMYSFEWKCFFFFFHRPKWTACL